MHYKTDKITFPLATVDAFLEGKEVRRVGDYDDPHRPRGPAGNDADAGAELRVAAEPTQGS